MDIRRFTHIGRPIDWSWPTNRAIAVITAFVGVASGAVLLFAGDRSLMDAAGAAFSAALAVFLAWAVARELDPDHQSPAFVAAGLSLLGIALLDAAATLLPMLWLLLLLRIVNRTTGLAPRANDLLLVTGLGIWLTSSGYVVAAAATGAGLWLNHRLDGQRSLWVPGLAVSLVAISVLVWISGDMTTGASRPDWVLLAATGATSALFVASTIVNNGTVHSLDDEGKAPISVRRLRVSHGLGLVTCIIVLSFAGREGFETFIPFWAAVLAVGLRLSGRNAPTSLHLQNQP